jgi:hypothetical protein
VRDPRCKEWEDLGRWWLPTCVLDGKIEGVGGVCSRGFILGLNLTRNAEPRVWFRFTSTRSNSV